MSTDSSRRPSTARPQFLELNGRRLFTMQILPTGPVRASALYLPPFAEEMNRCRASMAAHARALAARGWHVMQLDAYGTGESTGRIEEGDWALWRADAQAAAQWLAAQSGHVPMLWGIRTGALLAADAVAQGLPQVERLLLQQPVLDGKLFINQHLRLRIASQLVHDTARETTEGIRQRLAAGEDIEIAGYPLSGRLADGLSARRLADWAGALAPRRIDWLEIVANAEQSLALPSQKLVEALRQAGASVNTATVACPMIWQLQEPADASALLQASLALLGEA